jgi:hypothetical protein
MTAQSGERSPRVAGLGVLFAGLSVFCCLRQPMRCFNAQRSLAQPSRRPRASSFGTLGAFCFPSPSSAGRPGGRSRSLCRGLAPASRGLAARSLLRLVPPWASIAALTHWERRANPPFVASSSPLEIAPVNLSSARFAGLASEPWSFMHADHRLGSRAARPKLGAARAEVGYVRVLSTRKAPCLEREARRAAHARTRKAALRVELARRRRVAATSSQFGGARTRQSRASVARK